MATAVTATQRPLRVAFLWNETIQEDELLVEPRPVTFGETFPLPEGAGDQPMTVLTPDGNGYALRVAPGLGGDVWIGGQRKRVAELDGVVRLGPDDYGVVTLGTVALFFQHVRGAAPPPRQLANVDLGLVFAVLLAFLLCGSLGVIAFLDYQRTGGGEFDPFELNEELVTLKDDPYRCRAHRGTLILAEVVDEEYNGGYTGYTAYTGYNYDGSRKTF